ncbi:ECF RNA polymerase sigma factor SigM [Chitinophaga sp. MM2321]
MSFEQAYISCRGKVYGYFLKKTKSEEEAKDLLQTTFLKLWQYRHSLSEHYSLDQHLFNIARTVFIDAIRKQSRSFRATAVSDDTSQVEDPAGDNADERDINRRLHKLLEKMPAVQKKAFVLNRLQGYSYKEIATHLSISVKAVDNHIAKAVRQLKKYLHLIILLLCSHFFK